MYPLHLNYTPPDNMQYFHNQPSDYILSGGVFYFEPPCRTGTGIHSRIRTWQTLCVHSPSGSTFLHKM